MKQATKRLPAWLDNQMQRVYLEQHLRRLAHMTAAYGGVTTNVWTRQVVLPLDAWYFPKYPGRTVILPPRSNLVAALRAFIHANECYLREPDSWLGTWLNPATRACYLDIATCREDLAEARRIALELSAQEQRAIVALYNTRRNQVVYLASPGAPVE